MTKNIRVDCVYHISDFISKNIESGNHQILLPASAFLKLWSESTIEYCLEKVSFLAKNSKEFVWVEFLFFKNFDLKTVSYSLI